MHGLIVGTSRSFMHLHGSKTLTGQAGQAGQWDKPKAASASLCGDVHLSIGGMCLVSASTMRLSGCWSPRLIGYSACATFSLQDLGRYQR